MGIAQVQQPQAAQAFAWTLHWAQQLLFLCMCRAFAAIRHAATQGHSHNPPPPAGGFRCAALRQGNTIVAVAAFRWVGPEPMDSETGVLLCLVVMDSHAARRQGSNAVQALVHVCPPNAFAC